MVLFELFSAVYADPHVLIKNFLRLGHFFGVALGLGSATVLDLYIVRYLLTQNVTPADVRFVDFNSKVVTAGLSVLWITGLAFLSFYSQFDPPKLQNPKIWMKVLIVGVLTFNGFYIHGVVLPHVKNSVGKRIFDGLSVRRISLFVTSGVISATSWYVPLTLGAISQLNGLPGISILSAYFLILLLALCLVHSLTYLTFFRKERNSAPSSTTLMDSFHQETQRN